MWGEGRADDCVVALLLRGKPWRGRGSTAARTVARARRVRSAQCGAWHACHAWHKCVQSVGRRACAQGPSHLGEGVDSLCNRRLVARLQQLQQWTDAASLGNRILRAPAVAPMCALGQFSQCRGSLRLRIEGDRREQRKQQSDAPALTHLSLDARILVGQPRHRPGGVLLRLTAAKLCGAARATRDDGRERNVGGACGVRSVHGRSGGKS